MLVKVIRIEHPESELGVFRHRIKDEIDCLLKRHSKNDKMSSRHINLPTPYQDFDENYHRDLHFCGFTNKTQMNKWFKKSELKEIISLGFKIYELKINYTNTFLKSQNQVCFYKMNIRSKVDISDSFI